MKRYFSVLFALGVLSFLPAFAGWGNHQVARDGVECGREYNCCQCPTICYQPVVTYKPRYYCKPRCVYEPVWKCKKCETCEYQTRQKRCCRYVPQYYYETYCVKVPKCHYERYCTYRKRTVYDQCCEYIPCCKYKKCSYYDNQGSSCANGSCPAPAWRPNQRNSQGYYQHNPNNNNIKSSKPTNVKSNGSLNQSTKNKTNL